LTADSEVKKKEERGNARKTKTGKRDGSGELTPLVHSLRKWDRYIRELPFHRKKKKRGTGTVKQGNGKENKQRGKDARQPLKLVKKN